MEKINALIDKLQELKQPGTKLETLSYYTQLLYAEIMHAHSEAMSHPAPAKAGVSVILPGNSLHKPPVAPEKPAPAAPIAPSPKQPEPTAQPVIPVTPQAAPVREKQEFAPIPSQPAAAPEPEKKKEEPARYERTLFDLSPSSSQAQTKEVQAETKSGLQKELNEIMAQESPSLNDLLKEEKKELGHRLGESPVQDLRTAIGINDKFLFINELFRGDQNMYDRSLATINKATSLEEAFYWIERELKIKLGWLDKNETVQYFYSLIRKRFTAM